jgi:hypothetical protein
LIQRYPQRFSMVLVGVFLLEIHPNPNGIGPCRSMYSCWDLHRVQLHSCHSCGIPVGGSIPFPSHGFCIVRHIINRWGVDV